MPGPSAATKASARISRGKARKMSVIRISTAVDPAAVVAGDGADEEAEDRRGHGDEQHDVEGDPGAVDEPAPDVAAELVGAEPVPGRARRQQPVGEVLGDRVVVASSGAAIAISTSATTMPSPSSASGLRASRSQPR